MASHDDAGDFPPHKRRRGGIHQRQREATREEERNMGIQREESSKLTSKLVRLVLNEFAWGTTSAQHAQKLCEASFKDMQTMRNAASSSSGSSAGFNEIKHPIEQEVDTVASIGAHGKYSNKCFVDLMEKLEPNMSLPKPFRVRMQFKPPLNWQPQEMLLPHELFAEMFRHPPSWDKVVLPDKDLCLKFWKIQRDSNHPQWTGHPLAEMSDEQLSEMIPLSLHGDEVPVTGIGKQWNRKMVNWSWHSLVANRTSVKDSQFFIWSMFDKVGITDAGEAGGYKTLDHFMSILRWSFETLFKGVYPTRDVEGRQCHGSICMLLRLL